MRRLPLLIALAIPAPVGAVPPPETPPAVVLRFSVSLGGAAHRPAWQPAPPPAARGFKPAEVGKNLSEGWWGVGILAVGAAVWLYREQEN